MANFLKTHGQPLVYKIIHPLIVGLTKIGATPNQMTVVGFLLNVGVAAIFVEGGNENAFDLRYIGWSGAMILFAGLFDMIDGRLARVSGQSSRFGAFFDSVVDRYSELVMFLGICFYLSQQGYFLSALCAFLALIGSIMVSYIRARAEGLGIECSDGLMQRPERILLIGISAVVCGVSTVVFGHFRFELPFGLAFENSSLFTFPLFLLAVLANWTAWQRLEHCRKALNEQDRIFEK